MRERAAQRLVERLAADRERQLADELRHARWLSRERAADYLGVSIHQLRRAMTAGTSPAYAKPAGDHKQAPVVFLRDHLDQWLDDRAGHLARRGDAMREAAELAAAEWCG